MRPYTDVYLDGQRIRPKKYSKCKYGVQYDTDKDNVELTIKSYSRLHSRFWLIIELFFFVISIFGILDEKFGKFTYETHCKINLSVNDNTNVNLRINAPLNNRKVVNCESDNKIEEIENTYIIDNVAKKRNKILSISKILTVMAVAIGIIALV